MFITLIAFLGTILHHAEVVTSSQSNQGMTIFHASLLVLPSNSPGILTWSPSTTPFDLALGPDSPSADEPSGGTLGISGHVILTHVCATQADILTSASSTPAFANASHYNRTLPYRFVNKSHSFGTSFSPIHFRRRSA